jgi:hypothetical protein
MNVLVKTTLLVGIIGFGGFEVAQFLNPPSAMKIDFTNGNQSLGGISAAAQWGSSFDFASFGPNDQSFHLAIRVLSADSRHATFSYHFVDDSEAAGRPIDGRLSVCDSPVTKMKLDRRFSLAAYIKPNP